MRARRQREIGIRTAIGAPRRAILRSIFSRAGGQLALGLSVGLVAVLLLDVVAGGGLLGSHSTVILPGFGFLMLVAGLLAALGPARRALRVQPTDALRAE
ncbi:MAG: FtsX-like permease family protein [Gemmatimonas sp.]|nr:FtsX-like permease family protein [Gemmatimonas sp.]